MLILNKFYENLISEKWSCHLNEFPVTAITNYTKIGGLKQWNSQRSKGQTSKVSIMVLKSSFRIFTPFWDFQSNPCFGLCHFLACGHISPISVSVITLLKKISLYLPFINIYITVPGPTQYFNRIFKSQDFNLTTSAKTHFVCVWYNIHTF